MDIYDKIVINNKIHNRFAEEFKGLSTIAAKRESGA